MALDMIWYGMVWYHTYHDVAPEAKADPSVGTGRHVLDLGICTVHDVNRLLYLDNRELTILLCLTLALFRINDRSPRPQLPMTSNTYKNSFDSHLPRKAQPCCGGRPVRVIPKQKRTGPPISATQ